MCYKLLIDVFMICQQKYTVYNNIGFVIKNGCTHRCIAFKINHYLNFSQIPRMTI